MSRSRTARRFALAACLGLATPVSAQPRPTAGQPADLIAAAKLRQAVADQKAEAEVLDAVRTADRLARTNPAKAALQLKAAQNNLDLSAAVGSDARRTLGTLLQTKLAAVEGRPAPAAQTDPNAKAARETQAAALVASRKEAITVSEVIAAVEKDAAANRTAEASARIAAVRKVYPDNPAVLALANKDSYGSRIADAKELAAQQDNRTRLAMNDVARSALPAKGDIEFPADWKERTRLRTRGEVELSAKEKAVIAALDKPVSLAAREQPFEDVLQELSNKMGQELFVDGKSLADAGLDIKKPVSIAGNNLSARTFLRQILAGQGLTFVVQDEVIKVVTVEKARDLLVTRVYYLGDIVQGVGPFAGPLQWGPFVDYQQTTANVQVVMDAITNSVDPMSWKKGGGAGTMSFHFPSMSLVVRASTEVHAALGSKLGKGK